MEKLKLVIIEDEAAHFDLMKRAFAREFPQIGVYHFDEAGACLEQLDAIEPYLIIADYLMPGMNGIEFLQVLKQDKRDIPVIMITGQGDENIAVQAMKLGAWDYVVKSVDFFTLLPSIVQKVIRERRLKDSLQKTERRFLDLAENTPNWIWETDAEGTYTYSNPAVEKILGYRPEEVVGRRFYDFFPDELRQAQKLFCFAAMTAGGAALEFVNRFIRRDGQVVILETNAVPVLDKVGNLVGYRGIDRDITLSKRAEEQIRTLTQQLMKAQESERQRLSCDLHDVVGQELSSLKIGIDTLLDNQPEADPDMSQKVYHLSEMLQKTIMAVRNLAYTLRPATLDQLGLVQTVYEYTEDFSQRHGLQIDFIAAGMDDLVLDFDTSINLYRLIQEGLHNIKNHAEASNASIRLVASFPKIILIIEDNGKGFDVQGRLLASVQERRMGLWSMEERVALLGGKMKLESKPLQGTKIRIEVPCKEREP